MFICYSEKLDELLLNAQERHDFQCRQCHGLNVVVSKEEELALLEMKRVINALENAKVAAIHSNKKFAFTLLGFVSSSELAVSVATSLVSFFTMVYSVIRNDLSLPA